MNIKLFTKKSITVFMVLVLFATVFTFFQSKNVVKFNEGKHSIVDKYDNNVEIELKESGTIGLADLMKTIWDFVVKIIRSVSFGFGGGGGGTTAKPKHDPDEIYENYLSPYDVSWGDKSGNVKNSCVGHHHVKKIDNTLIACVALSQVSKDQDNCVTFVKNVYKYKTGGGSYCSNDYYSCTTSTGDNYEGTRKNAVTWLNGKEDNVYRMDQGSSHTSILYYNTSTETWMSVGGNMSGKVKTKSLNDVFYNSNIKADEIKLYEFNY